MADPVIVNRRPAEGSTNVDVDASLLFGLRDVDTRVDLSSVYMAITYGRSVMNYIMAGLPVITDGQGEALLRYFDDANVIAPPPTEATTLILIGPGGISLRIQKSSVDVQESFLFVRYPLEPSGPVAVESGIAIPIYTSANPAHSYYDQPNHTGAVFGLINWRRGTGVYLLFMHDGISKSIHVRGPATTASGARTFIADWAVDWTGTITYRIVWDDTPGKRAIYLFADDGTTEQSLVIPESTMITLEAAGMLPGRLLGDIRTGGPAQDVVTAVTGTSSPVSGDVIDYQDAEVAGYGRALVRSGGATGDSVCLRSSSESQILSGELLEDELRAWAETGTGEVAESGSSLQFSRTDADGVGELYRERDEPDLVGEEWFLAATFSSQGISHVGSDAIWAGFLVGDGTNALYVVLLDDFADKRLGIWSGTGPLTSDFYASGIVDWTQPTSLEVAGSATGAFVRAFINEAEVPDIDSGGYPGAGFTSLTSDTKIRAGFVRDAGIQHSGQFLLGSLWFFPNAVFADPADGLPNVGPFAWTLSSAGSPTVNVVGTRYEIESAEPTYWVSYGSASANYAQDGGAWARFYGSVGAWTDSLGSSSPAASQIGPVALLPYGTTKGISLCFTQSATGTRYVYVPGLLATLGDVLEQNAVGVLISAPVDFTDAHTYLVILKHYAWVRVFLDDQTVPVIDIPWASLSKLERPAHLAALPAGTYALIGSLGLGYGVDASLTRVRAGYGEGYDFSVTHVIDEETLQERVYGSNADMVVDFEDV